MKKINYSGVLKYVNGGLHNNYNFVSVNWYADLLHPVQRKEPVRDDAAGSTRQPARAHAANQGRQRGGGGPSHAHDERQPHRAAVHERMPRVQTNFC